MERRRLKGEIHALVSPELEHRGFLAAFTERTGGASKAPFESLNLGLHTGDDPTLIRQNHERLTSALGIGAMTTARQVHGHGVASVHEVGSVVGPAAGPVVPGPLELGEADALTTSAPSVPLVVMAADCVPLALASEKEEVIAAVHLGWRGIASGLTQRALRSFSDPGDIAAAIGPSVGPCHYEVGEDVVEAVADGTEGLVVTDETGPRPRLDLARTVEAVLRGSGLTQVDRADECTACEPARFFSHRRDGRTGRQALVAMRM